MAETRTGLARLVPTLALSRRMADNPTLAEAFRTTVYVWVHGGIDNRWHIQRRAVVGVTAVIAPAPTVQEMLEWLDGDALSLMAATKPSWMLHDPDALAEACLAMAKGSL